MTFAHSPFPIPQSPLNPLTPAPCPLTSAAAAAGRGGISLMEVLVSIGIVAIGLISVLSLLPVGGYQAMRANMEERKSALGLNAVQDLKNRGVLDPKNWVWFDDELDQWKSFATFPVKSADFMPPMVIDPWMPSIATSVAQYLTIADFPANPIRVGTDTSDSSPLPLSPVHPFHWLGMKRFTLAQAAIFNAGNSSFAPSRPLADALCISADDKFALRPDDASLPAESPYAVDASNNRLRREHEGLYSWIITLTPVELEPDHIPAQSKRQYLMSLVVFNRRVPQIPTPGSGQEEIVHARFSTGSTGIGGGDFELADLQANNADAKLSLARAGNWLMLCRFEPTGVGVAVTDEPQVWPVFHWYRIVAASETEDGQVLLPDGPTGTPTPMRGRTVTLAGPDWQPAQRPPVVPAVAAWPDPTTFTWPSQIPSRFRNYDTYACLFDSIVAVYQRPITLEGPSQWSQ